ncbi:class I SAM-dependent methyltransferase [Ramlibacter algicola]|uniref:Methyltransferase domain-containing protein n=1 Tax=Ramlibacter algicola TaxID=2795217 RepID=A0A934PYJ0_9BURK|nr:methyltransferase domain-containing protein [Ramlibacter algicola]MBK0391935.1 methyltransferase domain-containing protein [Ramlibacter algicola]
MSQAAPVYRCPHPGCDHAPLAPSAAGLACPQGHEFPFAPGTQVPVFAKEPPGANEYAAQNAAEVHDNALRWVFNTFRSDEATLRENLVRRLALRPGLRVLVTGAGAGNDLPYLARALQGRGDIHAQDFAQEMLLAGEQRHRALQTADLRLTFSVSDATNLPFADGWFDAAYHFGGINLFPDIARGMAEMARVVRPGGRVVIGDEGVAPWLRDTDYGRMLVRNNALYACEVPLRHLPAVATGVELTWELGQCFWVIAFDVAEAPPAIDIDVPHVGTRGGSIRTRYFGQLEGIDPALRDKLYQEAARRGLSRVEFLESLLRGGLEP